MASFVDSAAVFRQRARTIGISDADLTTWQGAGITSMGVLAFAVNYVPGAADDQKVLDFITGIFNPAGGAGGAASAALISQLSSGD